MNWDTCMQLVEVIKVFQSSVKVINPAKQPNKATKTLDDVREADFTNKALVMWGSEYVVDVEKCSTKKKKK